MILCQGKVSNEHNGVAGKRSATKRNFRIVSSAIGSLIGCGAKIGNDEQPIASDGVLFANPQPSQAWDESEVS